MLQAKHLILAKIESVYGTDPVPVPGTDALLVSGLSVAPKLEPNERNPSSASLSPWAPAKPSSGLLEVKFSVEMKGSGVATTPPEVDPLLRACTRSRTINASDVTYALISSAFESVTIYAYKDGLLHKVPGCMGEVEEVYEAGKIAMYNFTFVGLYQTPTDAAIPAGAVYDTTVPPIVQSIALTIGGYSAVFARLQISQGNAVSKRTDGNANYGVAGVTISGRKPVGSIDPEAVTRATHDFWLNMENATPLALAATIGSSAGNRIVIASRVVYDPFAWGEREGQRIYQVPLRLVRNAGDDEHSQMFN